MRSRDWLFRLQDVKTALDQIATYTAGMTAEQFITDPRTIDAVVFRFIVIGEAAKAIPDQELAGMPGIPWEQIRAFRNVLVHEYFGIRIETVWQTVQEDLPVLIEAIEAMERSRIAGTRS